MARIPRHLPHDNHLRLQQRPDGVVGRELGAVIRKDDRGLGLVVGFNLVAEGRGREAEPVSVSVCVCCLFSAVFDL